MENYIPLTHRAWFLYKRKPHDGSAPPDGFRKAEIYSPSFFKNNVVLKHKINFQIYWEVRLITCKIRMMKGSSFMVGGTLGLTRLTHWKSFQWGAVRYNSIGTYWIRLVFNKSSVCLFVILQNKAYDYKQNQTYIHTNVHTKGLQFLMAECTQWIRNCNESKNYLVL